jgi:hypothetical protein
MKLNNFEELKNPEEINDLLIKLSKNPSFEDLKYVKHLIDKLDTPVFKKIELNLIFLLGEIGKENPLEDKYLTFLSETYYKSDRWIRNEIIQTIEKISKNTKISDDMIKLIGYAVNDDYFPIKINALKLLLVLGDLPLFIIRNIFQALNLKNSEIEGYCVKIFEKFLPDFNQLFSSLDYLENYKVLKTKAIRSLILIYFRSPMNLEAFREKISTSKWDLEYKEKFFKEIDTYEKILFKKI